MYPQWEECSSTETAAITFAFLLGRIAAMKLLRQALLSYRRGNLCVAIGRLSQYYGVHRVHSGVLRKPMEYIEYIAVFFVSKVAMGNLY